MGGVGDRLQVGQIAVVVVDAALRLSERPLAVEPDDLAAQGDAELVHEREALGERLGRSGEPGVGHAAHHRPGPRRRREGERCEQGQRCEHGQQRKDSERRTSFHAYDVGRAPPWL